MAKVITVKITGSAHPDYDLFMDVRAPNGKQLKAYRGNRSEIDARYDTLAEAARKAGVEIELINE